MNKFSKYMRGCKDIITKVDNAIIEGAVLSPEEKFDYDFKSLILYRGEFKKYLSDSNYRVASFYAQVYLLLRKISKEGYTNSLAIKYFRKVNKKALMFLGYYSLSVEGKDRNGTLTIEVEDEDEDYYYEFEVHNVSSLIRELTAFAEYLVGCSGEVSVFIRNYFSTVVSDVYNEVSPKAYINMSNSRTLSSVLFKKYSISNIVYFKNYGGEYYGYDEGDIRKSGNA